jgi:hypothetical protein
MDSFGLIFTYVLSNNSTSNAAQPTPTILRFLATGEMDTSTPPNRKEIWDITNASRILAPAMKVSGLDGLKFWELIGRTFSMFYWLYLADFGQVSAIANRFSDVSRSDGQGSIVYPATNNIFVNQSLYQNYFEYIQGGQFPFNSKPLNHLNESPVPPLQSMPVTFLQSYSCQRLELKSAISLLISIITADYPFLVLGYTLSMWVASKLEKRRRDSKTRFSFQE